jgi:DNA-binding transcriptional MerR regulator
MYGEKELLRLQQILFYRELDFQLQEILEILDNRAFDLLASLENQKQSLKAKHLLRMPLSRCLKTASLDRTCSPRKIFSSKKLPSRLPMIANFKVATADYAPSTLKLDSPARYGTPNVPPVFNTSPSCSLAQE